VNWEKITWFERYVKEALPRDKKSMEQATKSKDGKPQAVSNQQ
jgi:hypothetical protein